VRIGIRLAYFFTANEMRRIFINCHVPKTAGTSLIDGFYQIFGQENCLIQTDIHDAKFPDAIRRAAGEKTFFSGHVTLPELIAVKRDLQAQGIDAQIVSSIREPIRHLLSVFLHTQRFGELRREENPASLAEYLANPQGFPTFDMSVSNSVVKYYSSDLERFRSEESFSAALENTNEIDFLFDAANLVQGFNALAERYEIERQPDIARLNENVRNDSRVMLESYKLLPEIANLNRFDCKLYGALALRYADATARNVATLKLVKPDEGMSLSEAMRRSPYTIWANSEVLVQFMANDMQIHPPARGDSGLLAPGVFTASGYLKIASGITLDERAASDVLLNLEITCGGRRTHLDKVIRPGDDTSIALEMTGVTGPCDLRMSTCLVGERPDFAILKLINPRFVLEA
jgi:hypothetical protein